MEVTQSGVPNEAQLAQINRYTRRAYAAGEVYVFTAVLCDNEVDRDFERFPLMTLRELQPLFVGKTGILDHEHTSRGQYARIFATRVETDGSRTAESGEPYARLVAEAYIPRGAETDAFIDSIESGIRKEVSIGCAVAKRTCSVCGKTVCGHVPGKVYDGVRCCRVLENATDAYEFSFVAVPAQRAAGVVKRFSRAEKEEAVKVTDIRKKLEEADGDAVFSAAELGALRAELESLEKRTEAGDRYREALREKILRMGAVAQPELSRGLLLAVTKGLSVGELEEMEAAFTKAAARRMPVTPQLRTDNDKQTPEDRAFCI